MNTDNLQFYPTPQALAQKMIDMFPADNDGIKFDYPVLEPSAGNGDLLHWFFTDTRTPRRQFGGAIHCVELDASRAATLKASGRVVVGDDFLKFNPVTPYQTIIMNPPFSSGALHLLKAIAIAAPNAQICCLLNAETIKNPFSRVRQLLLKTLQQQAEYKCDFVTGAFDGVDVETAIVYVRTPPPKNISFTFEHFKRAVVQENAGRQPTELQRADEISALVDRYRAEVKAAFALYDEIENYKQAVLFGDEHEYDAFKIEFSCYDKAGVLRGINHKYWRKLFGCQSIQHLLTHDAIKDLHSKIDDMAEFEFSEYNINNFKLELCKNLTASIDAAIMKTWQIVTYKYSMDNIDNIHYYNGWKTNKAFKCNSKIILPAFGVGVGGYGAAAWLSLDDIEKAMTYLVAAHIDTSQIDGMPLSQLGDIQKNADTKFFIASRYKKGTVHLTFKNPDLLKKFNLYCGRKFNWLPPSYGQKPYHDLTHEEKAVADSFEGEQSYNETFTNRAFYLADTAHRLLLE